jgi:hypothetical protein
MKRLFAILFSIFYIAAVSGITLNRHYCGRQLASVNISFTGEGHNCPCGSKKMKKGCCKDHNVQIKVKSEHKSICKLTVSLHSCKCFHSYPLQVAEPVSVCYLIPIHSYHDPPPHPNNSLLVLNSIFRI